MRILIVKLSSLGDVLHLLPALTDLHRRLPAVRVDWLVEPAFAEIPGWHPAVEQVIPIGLRQLKKSWWRAPAELTRLSRRLRAARYGRVIDAQGLIKSALLARLAGTGVGGLDARSAREPLSSRLYHDAFPVSWEQHAIERNRQLLAQIFDYALEGLPLDYGVDAFRGRVLAEPLEELAPFVQRPFLVGLHGTTWETKHWPEIYWHQLAKICALQGLRLLLPWGNAVERERAQRIQAASPASAMVLPRLPLGRLARLLVRAEGYVGVDTGLAHLAAALGVPGVSLYGPTDPARTGVRGPGQEQLASTLECAPCLRRRCPLPATAEGLIPCQAALQPQEVLDALNRLLLD